jgi:hypothetical protein
MSALRPLPQLEVAFCQLPRCAGPPSGADEYGEPAEVRLLASPHRPARKHRPGRTTLALERYAISLDERMVTLVHMGDGRARNFAI